jgi:hypothetical protein
MGRAQPDHPPAARRHTGGNVWLGLSPCDCIGGWSDLSNRAGRRCPLQDGRRSRREGLPTRPDGPGLARSMGLYLSRRHASWGSFSPRRYGRGQGRTGRRGAGGCALWDANAVTESWRGHRGRILLQKTDRTPVRLSRSLRAQVVAHQIASNRVSLLGDGRESSLPDSRT